LGCSAIQLLSDSAAQPFSRSAVQLFSRSGGCKRQPNGKKGTDLPRTIFTGDHLFVLESDGWQYAERKKAKEAVAVLAVTGEGVILTEQFRKPLGARVIDYPAGLVGDEDRLGPEETAKKELEEETGYVCESVEFLARGPSSPGITSEIVSFYRARGLSKRGGGGGVGGEAIRVHTVPLEQLEGWLQEREREGLLLDLKLWGGLYFLQSRP
jgi:ADP-ribose pyrophosphatase